MAIALSKPLMIKDVAIHSRVMLAPMAGVTDVVFRALVRHWAPQSLICTEMISSNGLVYSKRWDIPILDKSHTDHPIAYQLAAHKKDVLLEAATKLIAEKQPDTLDLNMGCPVKKITGNFEGCALMKEPDLAAELVSALVKEVDIPVTVKCRLGWDANSMNYIEFAQKVEAAGASMITLHARTRAQGYAPGCRWEAFGELKRAVNIPVIANGDINTLDDALHVINTYGVDGVMIGRGCQGAPWLIGQLDAALKHPEHQLPPYPTLEERLGIALEHARRMTDYKGEQGIREMRKHLPWYIKGFAGASGYRSRLTTVASLNDIEAVFADIRTDLARQGAPEEAATAAA